jgi:uncharacterized Fe-S cluster-containing protein
LCGNCFVVCPQNAKEIRNDIPIAKEMIKSGAPVYASVAPSFIANYGGISPRSMETALKRLGFFGAEETAIGATIVKRQYEKLIGKQNIIISSCCHTVNLLVQKRHPKALPYLARVLSPMLAHCKDIKRRFPNAKTVFIGPCISKKHEAETYKGLTDCVLTFEELSSWLSEERVVFEREKDENRERKKESEQSKQERARLFPTTGGILRSMKLENPDYDYLTTDGMENCVRALEDIERGDIDKCFIEMSACSGSCANGPAALTLTSAERSPGTSKSRRSPISNYIAINRFAKSAEKKDFDVWDYSEADLKKEMPNMASPPVILSYSSIEDVLKEIGKTKPEHELNCGVCGYETCRDKARAVIMGKANLTMCLPFLKEKAESFSDKIIKNTPNAIIVLNKSLDVQQINSAACKLLNLSGPDVILGDCVVRILDPTPFYEAADEGKNTYDKRVYLAEYQKNVVQTVIFDSSYNIIICIMRDVTKETQDQNSLEASRRAAVQITDKVIEKQMLAVQEIASLLGETAAETKVALTKLKESLQND